MNGNRFLQACLTVGPLLTFPVTLAGRVARRYRVGKGFAVKATQDRFDQPTLLLAGDTFLTKIGTTDTAGGLCSSSGTGRLPALDPT